MVRTNSRLYIDKDSRPMYSFIRKKSSLTLINSQIFLIALSIGYYYGAKKPLTKKHAFINYETAPIDLFSIIMLLAIDEYGEDIDKWINNPLDLFDLAEEYANAGIEILMKEVESHHDFELEEFLTPIIVKLYENVDFETKYNEFFSE